MCFVYLYYSELRINKGLMVLLTFRYFKLLYVGMIIENIFRLFPIEFFMFD